MQEKHHEIVILKPTMVFLSFLAAHLPQNKLPDLRILSIDNTAYVFAKKNTDEEMIIQIEAHYMTLFRHEVSRWLGSTAAQQLQLSFLDFLCCFKFEMHNHIIVKEHSLKIGNQLLVLRPKHALINWIYKLCQQPEILHNVASEVRLTNLQENATTIIKNFPNLTHIKPFVATSYYALFSAAMGRFSNHSNQWPLVQSASEFSNYFAIEIHTQLQHISC